MASHARDLATRDRFQDVMAAATVRLEQSPHAAVRKGALMPRSGKYPVGSTKACSFFAAGFPPTTTSSLRRRRSPGCKACRRS